MFITPAYAQAAGGAAPGFDPMFLIMMGLMLAVMYFLMIRPQQKKVKEHKALIAAIKRGDQVVTSGGIIGTVADGLLTGGPGDFGPISTATQTPGWALNVFDWNQVLYGVLIIVFLLFEPLGLFGIWTKIRNYWKGWPFSY